jgi:hypothetical protein
MRNACLIVLALASAACSASTSGGTREPTVDPMPSGMLTTGSGTMDVGATAEVTAIATPLPVSPDSAFKLLRAVYAKLAIPLSQVDSAHRTLANSGLKVHRQVGGMQMSRVVDCGDQIGVPNAETWDILMDITSYITADGPSGSKVWTRIQAVGNDPSTSGSQQTACTTQGGLEGKIGNSLKLMMTAK